MELPNEDKKFIRAPWNWLDTVVIAFFAILAILFALGTIQAGGD